MLLIRLVKCQWTFPSDLHQQMKSIPSRHVWTWNSCYPFSMWTDVPKRMRKEQLFLNVCVCVCDLPFLHWVHCSIAPHKCHIRWNITMSTLWQIGAHPSPFLVQHWTVCAFYEVLIYFICLEALLKWPFLFKKMCIIRNLYSSFIALKLFSKGKLAILPKTKNGGKNTFLRSVLLQSMHTCCVYVIPFFVRKSQTQNNRCCSCAFSSRRLLQFNDYVRWTFGWLWKGTIVLGCMCERVRVRACVSAWIMDGRRCGNELPAIQFTIRARCRICMSLVLRANCMLQAAVVHANGKGWSVWPSTYSQKQQADTLNVCILEYDHVDTDAQTL